MAMELTLDVLRLLKQKYNGQVCGVEEVQDMVEKVLIERGYAESDQRRYHVACPHCHTFQPLEWGGPETEHGIKWRANEAGLDAWYVCAHCHGEIYEHHKPGMLAGGLLQRVSNE